VKADLTLPVLEILPDGSYRSVLINPGIGGKARQQLIDAARAGEELDEDKAMRSTEPFSLEDCADDMTCASLLGGQQRQRQEAVVVP
jgi:hypothetical protein